MKGLMQTLRAVLGPVLGPSMAFSAQVQETHWKLIEDNFKHMLWATFGKPDMKDFGDDLVSEIEDKIKEDASWQSQALALILAFKRKLLLKYVDMLQTYGILLGVEEYMLCKQKLLTNIGTLKLAADPGELPIIVML